MRPLRLTLFAGIVLAAAAGAVAQSDATRVEGLAARDVAAQIALLDSADGNAPETLNGRLAYADYLVARSDVACRQELDGAQQQLAIVTATPAFAIVLPNGPARIANLQYRIHLARSTCAADATINEGELRDALAAALLSADFYRDAFDYQSLAIMQFDAAVLSRRLGYDSRSEALLEAAIATDIEYGFRKDAEENYQTLQDWRDDQSGPELQAAMSRNFPSRSVTLKFARSAIDAETTLDANYANFVEGKIIHSRIAAMLEGRIRPLGDDWVLSCESQKREYDFSEWPDGDATSQEQTMLLIASTQLLCPSISVSSKGEFNKVIDADQVAANRSAEMADLIRTLIPQGEMRLGLPAMLGRTVQRFSAATGLEAKAAEDYELAAATWIDATLDQGVWYDMSTPMLMPGTAVFLDYDIQFAFTHPLPCTPVATSPSCIEILVHATPNPESLKLWLKQVAVVSGLPNQRTVHYSSATDLRIVTDPDRLLPYVLDTRRFWYIATDGEDAGDPVIGSERIIATSTYH